MRAWVKIIFREYGIMWAACRCLYAIKLLILSRLPFLEKLLERKNADVKEIDVFKVDNEALRLFIRGLPEEKKQELVTYADFAVEGKIRAFSSQLLDYGSPINWHYNPLTGKDSPTNDKWYKIPDFDIERGDIKVIWEASRFSHFYLFSRAYLLTGDTKYYEAFSEQLNGWVSNNNYSFGANYKCGQECALRMVNTLLNYSVFENEGLTTPKDKKNAEKIVEGSYKKILNNFFYAHRCIRNNHTISELLGMIVGAACCKDTKQQEYAYKTMEKVIREQFFVDGGYRQFSFNYQRLALQDIECLLSLSEVTGRDLSGQVKKIILQSAKMLYQVQAENGDVPNYGSNDGALVFPVTCCGYRDFRPIINGIFYRIEGKRIYPEGDYDEELIWFNGGRALEAPKGDMCLESKSFEKSGLFSIRCGNTHLMTVLNDFDTRPCQFDQMHIDLWIDSKNILCDSGTFSYLGEKGAKMASTDGHNTLKVANCEQMKRRGNFMIFDWTKRQLVNFDQNCFEGKMKSSNGYSHYRRIHVKETADEIYYVIEDNVETMNETKYELLFHTPYDVVEQDAGVAIIEDNEELCYISGGKYKVENAERSLFYMKAELIKTIRFQGQTSSNHGGSIINIIISKKRGKTND